MAKSFSPAVEQLIRHKMASGRYGRSLSRIRFQAGKRSRAGTKLVRFDA